MASKSAKKDVDDAVSQLSTQLEAQQTKSWLAESFALLYLVAGQVANHECCCDECGVGIKKILKAMLEIQFVQKQ